MSCSLGKTNSILLQLLNLSTHGSTLDESMPLSLDYAPFSLFFRTFFIFSSLAMNEQIVW